MRRRLDALEPDPAPGASRRNPRCRTSTWPARTSSVACRTCGGVRNLRCDSAGDYPYCSGTAVCWIGVGGDPPVVRAVACAAVGVKKSAKLLGELNELNDEVLTARVYWEDGAVLVEQAMLAHTVDRRSLAHAGQSVAAVANDIGGMIAAVFGGQTPVSEVG